MTNYEMDQIEREKRQGSEIPGFATDEEAGFVDDQKDKRPLYDYSGNDQKNIEEIQRRVHLSLKQKEQWREYVLSKLDNSDTIEDHRAILDVRPPLEKEEVTNPKHYDKVGFVIQPLEYIIANELDFLEGNVIKYVSRYPHKGGVNDLLKARTYIEKLINRERMRNE